MKTRPKILIALLGVILAVGTIAYAQERRQQSILATVRVAIAVGDSQEKVEQAIREKALPLKIDEGGRSYTTHVWFHFRPDVTVTVALNGQGQVETVTINDLVE